MNINEQYHDLELLDTAPYQYIGRDGVYQERSEPLIKEHLMDVYINDKLTMKLICIPQLLTELVLGRLLTEGLIQSTEEIEHIYICKYGKRAKVYLREAGAACSKEFVEITPTCCTGNHILNDYFLVHTDVRPVAPIPWEASQIFPWWITFARACRCMIRPRLCTAACWRRVTSCFSNARTSGGIMRWTKPLDMRFATVLI